MGGILGTLCGSHDGSIIGPNMKPFEIFRAGTHISNAGNKVTITTADLAACAAAYDTSLYQAPLVVGHPKNEDPAFGWIKSIEVKGDVLVGVPDEVNPAFAQMVLKPKPPRS